ncbi:MAG: lysylphosphatidylglycerol synthase transmembrane domain-containing protein [Gaiellaceae bacterium]
MRPELPDAVGEREKARQAMTAEADRAGETTAGRRRRFSKRHVLGVGVGVAVVVATFAFVLPRIADYRDVWGVVKTLSWRDIALLAGATILNLVTFAPPWMAALPGLRFRQAFVVTQASTASTYIAPGGVAVGMALSFAMLRAWGFGASPVSLAVAVTGVWNQLAMLAFPTVALGLLTLTGDSHGALDTIAYLGLAIFVLVVAAFAAGLSTPKLARWIGDLAARIASWGLRLIRRKPVHWDGEAFVRFRDRTNRLLNRRWHVLTLATLAGHLTVFLVLLVSLRVLGVPAADVSAVEAFAAWSLVRLLGSIPITPGGLGVVELGLTTALVGFGGDQVEVVAAVLVYRVWSVVPTLLIGLLAGATWKRHRPDYLPTDPASNL